MLPREVPSVSNTVNVALPKGRLGDKVYEMFKAAGYPCEALENPDRRLTFENPGVGIRYFWVKPSDVAIYVEKGAADIGVAGKDILMEHVPDVYELLDVGLGKCRMCVAAPSDFRDDPRRTLRVATKFPRVAKEHYSKLSRDIEIIKLNGSIELAPILGLSDVIVDIVETGATLKQNGLVVYDELFDISARLIANKSGYRFKSEKINMIKEKLQKVKEDRDDKNS